MSQPDRRTFVKQTSATALGAAIAIATAPSNVLGASKRVMVGVIGCGGRGLELAKTFQNQPDAAVAYVCDPDRQRLERAQKETPAPQGVTDLRRVLDDKSIDAVVIAACDHWHAPAAVLACQAGKHVYVEKPCSHNVLEGRLMVQAARQYNRVMQHGTQTRSSLQAQIAIQMLRDGAIGKVLVAKHVNSQRRANIGRQTPSQPPEHIDYDLWVGPAEWLPYQSNFVHYNWHWFYNFGTGDIGNDGVHGIDVARWGLGVETHPSFISGCGSKMFFDDDQQFPDTYTITFEYPGDGRVGHKRLLIYEQRIWSPYRQDSDGNSVFFYGTEGMMTLGQPGIRVYGRDNKLVQEQKLDSPADAHQRNFLDAIRAGTPLAAGIEVGHLSSTLSHLGNIVSRLRRAVEFDPRTEQIVGDDEAAGLLGRKYREGHWAALGSA